MNLAKQQDTVNTQKSKACLYKTNEISGTKINEKIPFPVTTTTKNKVPWNKCNQGGKRPVLRQLHIIEERN